MIALPSLAFPYDEMSCLSVEMVILNPFIRFMFVHQISLGNVDYYLFSGDVNVC